MTAACYPLALLASTLALTGALAAQVPGSPVLQNAFLNPGIGVAGNFGGGSGQSFYGAAAAWGPGGGRFQLSGAAGVHNANGGTRGAYGARLAAHVWSTRGGSLGAAAFAGVGGAPSTESDNLVTNPATLIVPGGITIAYQRPMGLKRGISIYVSPMYQWWRFDDGDMTTSSGVFRGSFGVDVALSQALGVTAGGEVGATDDDRDMGSTFGVAVTYVLGRR
jgi:hypothetical protein